MCLQGKLVREDTTVQYILCLAFTGERGEGTIIMPHNCIVLYCIVTHTPVLVQLVGKGVNDLFTGQFFEKSNVPVLGTNELQECEWT